MLTLAVTEDSLHLSALSVLILLQRACPEKLMTFAMPDLGAASSIWHHFSTSDFKHFKRHIWGCFKHLKQSTAPCFIFQKKRMTGIQGLHPVATVLGSTVAIIQAGMYTHIDRHSHRQSIWRNASGTNLQTKKWQYLPARAAIICSEVGSGWFLSKVYMDITIPGVQKPHWEPWHLASLSWNEIPQTPLIPALISILINALLNGRCRTKCCLHNESDF